MRRRAVLGALGGSVPVLGGCLTFSSDRPREELPDVTVTYRWSGVSSSVAAVAVRASRDELRFRVSCREGQGDGYAETASVDDGEYVALQRLVVRSEPASWPARLDCRNTCGTDDGRIGLKATVDGTVHETDLDPMADLPSRIDDLVERMRTFENRFDIPTCG